MAPEERSLDLRTYCPTLLNDQPQPIARAARLAAAAAAVERVLPEELRVHLGHAGRERAGLDLGVAAARGAHRIAAEHRARGEVEGRERRTPGAEGPLRQHQHAARA